ncbi:hypothetical protein CcCBS67573_g05778 [Chytriomyces confervae]|uniref:VWFA domain-containing protein n=1 Tax=Chytriomyces confervae TaxID=246404 RepID=A0A507FBB7_9FUNG|nr:hypothetical protein CcCBS67573_g05778 [Chytriomyces confervae]
MATSPPSYADITLDDQMFADDLKQTMEAMRLDSFKSLVNRHEISKMMAVKLRKLEAYDIVIICDDSTSMNTKTAHPINPRAAPTTRWEELKVTVQMVTEIAATLDDDGIDVHFLNRDPIRNVFDVRQLDDAFESPPSGHTPITRVLKQVLSEKRSRAVSESNKKLLILIATDGVPTTDMGFDDRLGLWLVLMQERDDAGDTPVVFLLCTDDEKEVGYLNEWDKEIPGVDTVDDYYTERREILAVQGDDFCFSKGDWVCKMLLGAVDDDIDALDERRVGVMEAAAFYPQMTVPRMPTLLSPTETMKKKKKKWGLF